jgi:hypothetical protein
MWRRKVSPLKAVARLLQMSTCRGLAPVGSYPRNRTRSQAATRRSLSRYERGCNTTASTTVKTAVLAPIPSARVSTAVTANPGLFTRVRTE